MSVRLVAIDRVEDGAGPAPTAVRVRSGSSTMEDDRSVPLPRHLLVGLHALAADIALVRQSHGADAPLCASLDRSLARLDGLVDSIYDMAAAPRAFAAPAMSASRPAQSTRAREVAHARS